MFYYRANDSHSNPKNIIEGYLNGEKFLIFPIFFPSSKRVAAIDKSDFI